MVKLFFASLIYFIPFLLVGQNVTLEWANSIGSANSDFAYSMAIDSENNTYLTGSFMGSMDIDPGSGVMELVANGLNDIFIQKLSSDGALVWAHSIGGVSNNAGSHINVDENDDVYIIGNFSDSIDVDPSENEHYLYSDGVSNYFVLKLNSDGDFLWAVHLKSPSYVYSYASAFDENSKLFITGNFSDSLQFGDFEEQTLYAFGSFDIFVASFTSEGELDNAFSIGGTAQNAGNGIDIDVDGNILIGGYFEDSLDFDPGPEVDMHYAQGILDGFVLKLNNEGEFIWVKTIKGASFVNGYALSSNPMGDVYLAGTFSDSADFDPGENDNIVISNGSQDAFMLRLDSDGNFDWVYTFGGASLEIILGIDIDENSNCYFAGYFGDSVNVDVNNGENILVSNGGVDIINGKVDPSGNIDWAFSLGAESNDIAMVIKHDPDGNIYACGNYQNTVDFDPSMNTFLLSSNGNEDFFIYKMGQIGLSVNENNLELAYSIYPNPNGGNFRIKNSEEQVYSIKIFSMNGQLIFEKQGIISPSYDFNLNMPAGMYFLELAGSGKKSIQKIIIQ